MVRHPEYDGHQICGFVIMPNHVHTMIHFKRVKKSINQTISNGKRFLSYAWVVKWKETNCINVVRELQAAVKESDRAKGKIHQVFRHSFDWKECREDRVIMQKLDYIHNNPCSGKWQLSTDPASYLHSSARFYTHGTHSYYPVTPVRDVQSKNRTSKKYKLRVLPSAETRSGMQFPHFLPPAGKPLGERSSPETRSRERVGEA
jgi:hypothetical protein